MKKICIAMFISSLQKGGSERVMVNLASFLHGKGYPVVMVTQYRAENEYELPEGIKRVFSEITEEEKSGRMANFSKRCRKLRFIWKNEKPDVILSFIGKNNLMALLTTCFLSIPVVVSVRGEPVLEYASPLLRIMSRILFRRAAGMILQTKSCEAFFPPSVIKKSIILKNPLNPAFLVQPVLFKERQKLITAVGRVDANKNHEMIIDVFSGLSGEFPDYKLVVYGEGELREYLINKVKKLGMADRISLPGGVADVAGKIAKASAFVLSSYSEGMPNTLMEAMALGIPVIASDCPGGGPGELIQQGENGLLFPPGDKEALASCLRDVLGKPELARKLSRRGAKIQLSFDPARVNGDWENFLLDCAHSSNKRIKEE